MFKMPLEAFTNEPNFPFFIQYGEHQEPLFLHGHDGYSELVIVLSGKAVHIVDNEKFLIEKGDVFVIGADTEHGYDEPQDFRICNIMFRDSFLHLPEFDIAEEAGFHALFVLEPKYSKETHFTSHLRLNASDFHEVSEILKQLYTEYHQHSAGRKVMVKVNFLRLVVTLSRLYDTKKIESSTGIVKLAPAFAYIEKNYQNSLSVAELAQMVGYSQRQFIRLFKKATGDLPLEYITHLRMQYARELLKNSELSITEIAMQCGYTDSNYFSKLFHKNHGVTPKDFRKV